MSTTKLATLRKFVTRGAAVAALALPLALVPSPAEAATVNGCTVTPLTPVRIGTSAAGIPIVRFSTRITCVANRIVRVVDQRGESDAPAGIAGDDFYGSSTYLRTFATAGSVVVSTIDLVTNTGAGVELAYHRTNMRVASIDRILSRVFQNSPVLVVNI